MCRLCVRLCMYACVYERMCMCVCARACMSVHTYGVCAVHVACVYGRACVLQNIIRNRYDSIVVNGHRVVEWYDVCPRIGVQRQRRCDQRTDEVQ